MKRVIILLALMAGAWFSHGAAQGQADVRSHAGVPREAVQVLKHILETDAAPEGYVGGRRWENRERRLPLNGHYREYDIHPKVRGRNRGPERIVFDWKIRKAWYTPDHYRTFIPFSISPQN